MRKWLLLLCAVSAFGQTQVDYTRQIKNGPLFSDGNADAPLAQSCSTVGGGTLAVTKHWTAMQSVTLPCTIQFTGGSIQPASGQTVTLNPNFICGTYQKCFDLSAGGNIAFTSSPGTMLVTWCGAVADGVTDNYAAIMGCYNALPVSTGRLTTTATGQPIRSGALQFPASQLPYVIGTPLLISGGVAIQGISGANGGSPIATIQLALGVATGGERFVVAIDPTDDGGPTPNETFGSVFEHILIDCNGGVFAGNNTGSSGLLFYGAQGSRLNDIQLDNCGMRGLVIGAFNSGTNFGGFIEAPAIYATGIGQGPGVEIHAGSSHFGVITVVQINPMGTFTDIDGDPNPGVLIEGIDNDFSSITVEQTWQPLTVTNLAANSIHQLGMTPSGAGRPIGVLIKNSADNTVIDGWFSFANTPFVYTNAVVDRTYGYNQPGNLTGFPLGRYSQNNNSVFTGALSIAGPRTSNVLGGLNFTKQYTNAVPAQVTQTWSFLHNLGGGTSPSFDILQINPPQNSPVLSIFNFCGPQGTATVSSGNYNSASCMFLGTYWDGMAAAQVTASMQLNIGTGTAPTKTLTIIPPVGGFFNIPSLPASAGSGGLYVCVDSAGNFYKKSTCP